MKSCVLIAIESSMCSVATGVVLLLMMVMLLLLSYLAVLLVYLVGSKQLSLCLRPASTSGVMPCVFCGEKNSWSSGFFVS